MKQWLIALLLLGGVFRATTAAETNDSDEQRLSVCMSDRTECDNPLAVYELYATHDNYEFIKLDTRNGKIWLSSVRRTPKRKDAEKNLSMHNRSFRTTKRRKALHPNTAFNTFVLLDRISGKIWQVKWFNGFDLDSELIPINPD